MKVARVCNYVAVLTFVIAAVLYLSGNNTTLIGDVTFIVVSAMAAIGVFEASRFVRLRDERKVWTYLSVGVFLFFIAEVVWGYYELILGIETPSAAMPDVFWLAGNVFLVAALYFKMQNMFMPAKSKHVLIATILGGGLLLLLMYNFVQTVASDGLTLGTAIDFVYPIFSVIQAVLSLFILLPLLKLPSKLSLPWIAITTGFMSFVVYDSVYAITNFLGVYSTGDYIDLFYILAYVLLAMGGYFKLGYTLNE